MKDIYTAVGLVSISTDTQTKGGHQCILFYDALQQSTCDRNAKNNSLPAICIYFLIIILLALTFVLMPEVQMLSLP